MLASVVLVAIGIIRGAPSDVRPWSLPSGSLPATTTTTAPSPAPIPRSGPGTLVIARTSGPILGSAGALKRFRIAVESNVADQIEEFIRMTEVALGDPRGWIADNRQRFQRVPDGAPHDFTIALVTRQTAHKLCGAGGLDIRLDGVPYTSCQIGGQVVVNLDRWQLSVPDYGASLETYRLYVINHEVGHVLGRGHQPCPGPGEPAPVMQQQTLGMRGCVANPWPYAEVPANGA